jgi:hypothetical protein
MSIQITRNTRMWVSTATGTTPVYTPQNTWEVEVQDDFSFSQSNNSSDISVTEAGPKPTRGTDRYNDSLAPADWNFSTYLQPYLSSLLGGVATPDFQLWHSLASPNDIDTTVADDGVEINDTNMLLTFKENSAHVLNKFDLLFHVDNVWYKVTDCQVGTAAISVSIEDLGMVAWSGQGKDLTPLAAAPFDESDTTTYSAEMLSAPYIENKLTTLVVINNATGVSYDIPVTGGNVDINNNITYLTPNTLSRLDKPVASFTGSFDVSGTLEAYLRTNATGLGGTAELLAEMIATNAVKNSFTIAICMGGKNVKASPGVVIVIKNAHLGIPTIGKDDLLTTSIELKALPTELSAGDEVYLGFSPTFTSTIIDRLIATGDGKA